ncbi:MAG: Protein YhfA [Anaerolineales bacterium]|nr:Protein YhfA [Anaerolineales bacterium]
MDGKVTWNGNMTFEAVGDSNLPILFDSPDDPASARRGPGPMEVFALSLAGCTAMDVISILQKKKQAVTGFEVRVHAERATDHPKVYTRARLEYRVSGRGVQESAVTRAIELSVEKYCSVHAMLSRVFPIDVGYVILEEGGGNVRRVVSEGTFTSSEEIE